MKLYLLDNGMNLRIMSIDGPSIAPEEFVRASSIVRDFFNLGRRALISEITIRPEAVETIVRAIAAFRDAPVPLHSALSELLNFCRDSGDGGVIVNPIPAAIATAP